MSTSKAVLKRLDYSDHGIFGQFTFNGFTCFSGEIPWRDNRPNISAIPQGKYLCSWTDSKVFKRKMYQILPVPGRGGIRIHSANLMGDENKGYKKQLNGCIALGMKLGKMDGQKALLLSKPAVRQFEALAAEKNFILEIL